MSATVQCLHIMAIAVIMHHASTLIAVKMVNPIWSIILVFPAYAAACATLALVDQHANIKIQLLGAQIVPPTQIVRLWDNTAT